ncbi:type II secretion system protein [bacterium]|nr:MAG: type II secretion system protein [bacterium]
MNYSNIKARQNKRHGFTIVELLIVIVVIGILAAIVILSYNGIQTKAKNTARASEVKEYAKLFNSYKLAKINSNPTQDGWPDIAPGTYCLGTGFPQSPSSPSLRTCRDWQQPTSPTNTALTPNETSSAVLMNELRKAGGINNADHSDTSMPTIGPYVQIHTDRIVITTILIGKTQAVCGDFSVHLDTANPDDAGWDGFAATGKPMQSCGVIIER